MVKIIADSTCDLSDATLKKYDIDMLPLYIHMGENEYKDRLEVTVEDIFNTTLHQKLQHLQLKMRRMPLFHIWKRMQILLCLPFQKICQQLPMLCDLLQTILNMKIMYL